MPCGIFALRMESTSVKSIIPVHVPFVVKEDR